MAFSNSPVAEAAKIDEIGFPEFTAKLITDTFDALVSANMRQTEAYIELVQSVAGTLEDFINNTSDDISGEELLQFLSLVAPNDSDSSDPQTKVRVGQTLSADEAGALNDAVALPAEAGGLVSGNANVADDTTAIDETKFKAILDAVARRLSVNRFTLLKEMVKQGILRLVVENGLIETRLTFSAYASSFYQKNADSYQRTNYTRKSRGGTGRILSLFGNYSSRTSRSSVSVRTTKETHRDISGSRVQIFGMVRINFKTDYLPLNV